MPCGLSLWAFDRQVFLDVEVGGQATKTTDLNNSPGYVILMNDNEEALTRDYNRVIELEPTLFSAEGEGESAGS